MAKVDMCVNHADRRAVIRCRQCGKSICDLCVVEAAGAKCCSQECAGKFQQFAARGGTMIPKAKVGIHPLLKGLAGLIVLAAAAFIVLRLLGKI
ncbi:MAG: B-box zinc finger protein [Planctomycetes bacterium]|nr:B-box zinc finger protein [Planctomycetota bacterium]